MATGAATPTTKIALPEKNDDRLRPRFCQTKKVFVPAGRYCKVSGPESCSTKYLFFAHFPPPPYSIAPTLLKMFEKGGG
jgi:hypothetical protein